MRWVLGIFIGLLLALPGGCESRLDSVALFGSTPGLYPATLYDSANSTIVARPQYPTTDDVEVTVSDYGGNAENTINFGPGQKQKLTPGLYDNGVGYGDERPSLWIDSARLEPQDESLRGQGHRPGRGQLNPATVGDLRGALLDRPVRHLRRDPDRRARDGRCSVDRALAGRRPRAPVTADPGLHGRAGGRAAPGRCVGHGHEHKQLVDHGGRLQRPGRSPRVRRARSPGKLLKPAVPGTRTATLHVPGAGDATLQGWVHGGTTKLETQSNAGNPIGGGASTSSDNSTSNISIGASAGRMTSSASTTRRGGKATSRRRPAAGWSRATTRRSAGTATPEATPAWTSSTAATNVTR